MSAATRQVNSRQQAPHPELDAIVRRHLDSEWRRPIAPHTVLAFESIRDFVSADGELVLDSCCGTGDSTRALAQRFREARVLGVDKSAARLSRHTAGRLDNYRLLRADVNDLWRLLVAEGVAVTRHFLLYPNPYPKPGQFRKRWHGSPAFRSLLQVGGSLEVRSNWRVYVDEFAMALAVAGKPAAVTTLPGSITPVSAFEKKYASAGQSLHCLTASL